MTSRQWTELPCALRWVRARSPCGSGRAGDGGEDPFGTKLENIAKKLDSTLRVVAQAGQVPQAWLDVQAERRRQITVEGFDTSNDDGSAGQIALAAGCYALHAGGIGTDWPDGVRKWLCTVLALGQRWWKPTTPRRDLVKARPGAGRDRTSRPGRSGGRR